MKKKLFLKFFVFAVIGALVTMTSCKDYDDDISRLNNELSTLKGESAKLTELNSLKSELEGKISSLQTEINTLKGDLAKYATKDELSGVKDDLAAAKTELEGQIKSLESEITALNALIAKAATQEELDEVKAVLAKAKEDLADAKEELEGVKESLKDYATKAELDALKENILAKTVELEKYNIFKDWVEGEIKDLKDTLVDFQKALDKAATQEEVDAIKAKLEALEVLHDSDLDKLKTDIAEHIADFEALLLVVDGNSDAIADIKGDLKDQMALILANADDIKALKEEVAKHKKAIADIEAEIETLNEELAKAATKEELEIAKGKLNDALGKLSDAHEALDKVVKENTANILANKEAIQANKDAIKDLQEDLKLKYEVLNGLIEALDDRVLNLEDGVSNLEGRAQSLEDAVDDILEMLEDVTGRVEATEGRLDGVEGRLDVNDGLIKGLIASVGDLEKELTEVESRLNGSIEDLGKVLREELEDAFGLLDKAIDALEKDLNGKIDDLKVDLKNFITDITTVIASRLTDITLAPNAYVGGIEAIEFTTLTYKPMEAGEDKLVPTTGFTKSTAKPAIASYKFDPRSFDLSNADYKYVDRQATVRSTTASNLVTIEGKPVKNFADGTVNFTLRRQNAHDNAVSANNNKKSFVQLEATLKGKALNDAETDVVISAEQELVYDNLITPSDIFISDKATLATAGDDAHYPVTFDAATAENPRYEAAYDKVFDLLKRVATCEVSDDDHSEFDISEYNLSYKFSVASSVYNVTEGSTVTNQQDWVELVNETDGTYKAKGFNKELIGRTPILKVELVDVDGNVVRRAFVKVKFVAEKTADITVGESHDLVYKCNDTKAQFEITEQYIRDNVYRIITSGKETSMSHEEFWNTYDATTATATTKVTKNGSNYSMTSVPQIVDGPTGVGTATKKIVWDFTHGELGTIGVNGSQFVASVTVKNKLVSSEFPEYVTFQFTVNVTLPNVNLPAANKVENDPYWSKDAEGNYVAYQVNINVPNSPTSPASQAQFSTSLPQAYTTYNVVTDGACVTSYYKVVDTYSNGVRDTHSNGTSNPLPGVGISGNNITLDKTGANSAAVKAALNSKLGLQASVAHIYVLENGEEITVNTFLVNFIRPVNLNMPSGVTVTDAQDNGDIASFQWNGLLTDWRQFPIVAPEWSSVEHSYSYWKYVYQPEYTWKDGYYEEESPAQFNVEYDEISFVTNVDIELVKGTTTFTVQRRLFNYGSWSDYSTQSYTTSLMETVDQVNTAIEAKRNEILTSQPNDWYAYRVVDNGVTVANQTVTQGQTVTYTYVKDMTFVPAVYNWVDGEWIIVPHTPTPMPTFDGTSNGQVVGDWMWTTFSWSQPSWNAGQYWFYYGPFQSITADITNVTTNLTYNDGQLPTQVTLTQVGNTIKYVNVGAPIAYSYEIYIPVSVNYGWGTVESVWTVTVNPVN